MKWLNCEKVGLMLVGFVAAIMFSGGNAKADFTFGEPTLFDEPVNSTGIEYFDCISADGLEVYIEKPVTGGIGSTYWDIYVSTRETTNDPWSVPVNLGPIVNSNGYIDMCASLSSDGLELYFSSNRPGGYGPMDIWVTKRSYRGADWGTPVNLGPPINTSSYNQTAWITSDDCELYFSSDRPGGSGHRDIWVSQRTSKNDPWQTPVNLGPVVNSTARDNFPCLAPGGLVLFFSDYDNTPFRPGGYGQSDMYMTRRKSTADPWEEPVNLGPDMNTDSFDSAPRISPDGSVLYFTSSRPGIGGFSDIWQAPIIPIVDFNGDWFVDIEDLLIMIDNWGTDESLCDIGPMPWGDGIVDESDLKVLMSYWGQEIDDPAFLAHWKLDETDGSVAYDSEGEYDGTLNGNPLWQPAGGMVDGALQFNGVDDYIGTPSFILSTVYYNFSVFAWIKGGAPGQVIISQIGRTRDWLYADPANGCLMTELRHHATNDQPLLSEAVITDGEWHRVGLVWDLSKRTLYVDDVEVASDEQESVGALYGGLNIGTGKSRAAGSFFSGLIDDVRIYNRAVTP